jgi:hypothetical protein
MPAQVRFWRETSQNRRSGPQNHRPLPASYSLRSHCPPEPLKKFKKSAKMTFLSFFLGPFTCPAVGVAIGWKKEGNGRRESHSTSAAVGVDNKDRGERGKDSGSRQYISRGQSIRGERVDEPLKWRPIQRADNGDQVDNDDGQWAKGH